jgi:hypothetical protein
MRSIGRVSAGSEHSERGVQRGVAPGELAIDEQNLCFGHDATRASYGVLGAERTRGPAEQLLRAPKLTGWRALRSLSWLGTALGALLVPKCPLCIAAAP